MIFLAKLIGVLLVAGGGVLFLKPHYWDIVKAKAKEVKWMYSLGAVRFLVGILLISVASTAYIPWMVFTLGVLFVASGILMFILKKEIIGQMIDMMFSKPQNVIHLYGSIPLAIGVLILYSL